MKSILILLALALAAVTAAPQTSLDEFTEVEINELNVVDKMVSAAIHEAEALADDIVKLVEHQLLEIVMYPMHQLEQAVSDIDARRQESEECVANEALHVAGTVETATVDFYKCGRDATTTSIQLVLDTKKAVLQLTYDGYSLVKEVRSCMKKTNSVMKKVCKAKCSVDAGLFAYSGQKSIRHLIGLRKTVPAVGTDAKACTLSATEQAMYEFGMVNENIDVCIYNLTH
ncbi:uncharacterized protein Dwil_GK25844 [Drosophila willistoni]|uniref:Protein TsetseEP domain-containing protein n=1 Tax=Drosophila willistoni TaxID=7260 RepID=B4NCE9_DROWI|nr:uncharacterized protein LOC6648703 [Drosophila willistoni]EDW82508.1 uncharacterized protein Dwil_GK25844 [Drosophila willistoni]